ncbi:hypothetical protein PG993_002774 [Apiospora rasikravindrae]|uniref:Uncharacterized protein n=1 Tax=Apiospora rasikravindrae TaxID=990691 RepID=A0ABR1TXL7_9PEZI
MDMLWSGFRRSPNKGDMSIFRRLSPRLLELAKCMYGEDRDTAYILVILLKEPAGAKGPASDAIMELNARFYDVLKDGQAGEAEAIEQCYQRRRRYRHHCEALRGGREGWKRETREGEKGNGDEDSDEQYDRWIELQQEGKSLVDLFEVQVHHPISGRLLVGPVDKQKNFTRS